MPGTLRTLITSWWPWAASLRPTPTSCPAPGLGAPGQVRVVHPALNQTLTVSSWSPDWCWTFSPRQTLDYSAGSSNSSSDTSPISCCSQMDPDWTLDLPHPQLYHGRHWSPSPAPALPTQLRPHGDNTLWWSHPSSAPLPEQPCWHCALARK